jgi:hypothetical protein
MFLSLDGIEQCEAAATFVFLSARQQDRPQKQDVSDTDYGVWNTRRRQLKQADVAAVKGTSSSSNDQTVDMLVLRASF